jgi:hypothetical protein
MSLTSLLTTLGIGAGAMYFMDPNAGKRRRARVADLMRSVRNLTAKNALGFGSSGVAHTKKNYRATPKTSRDAAKASRIQNASTSG